MPDRGDAQLTLLHSPMSQVSHMTNDDIQHLQVMAMWLSLTHLELSSRTRSYESTCHTEVLSSHQEFTESFIAFRSLQSFSEEVCNVVTRANVTDL